MKKYYVISKAGMYKAPGAENPVVPVYREQREEIINLGLDIKIINEDTNIEVIIALERFEYLKEHRKFNKKGDEFFCTYVPFTNLSPVQRVTEREDDNKPSTTVTIKKEPEQGLTSAQTVLTKVETFVELMREAGERDLRSVLSYIRTLRNNPEY